MYAAALAALGAALSLLVSGFVFPTSNNIFHLPIIGRLYDEPRFGPDVFIQSLRHYAAGPFLLLQGADRYIDPGRLFLGLAFLSRFLTFAGFLACGRLLEVTARRDRLLLTVLLAFASLLQGNSFAGSGGLFISAFTHSEIANGLSLIAIYQAARGRLTTAFALNGVTFFTNAFVAVWNAVPFAFIACLLLMRGRITLAQLLVRGAIGLVLFLVIASPVIANILSNPEFGRPTAFDYRVYLAEYYPFHFLFQWNSWGGRFALAAVTVTGILAFGILARRTGGLGAGLLLAALAGYVVVYAAGIVAPRLTGSATVLNLHLLRAGGSVQLLTALGGLTLATRWLTSRDSRESAVFGPLLTLALCTLKSALLAAPVIIVGALAGSARWLPAFLPGRLPARAGLVVILLGVWSYTVWSVRRANEALEHRIATWADIGHWARRNTPDDAMFLIPTTNMRDDLVTRVKEHGLGEGSEIFEYASHRRVWIDFKRGAAVMWLPSYYPTWKERVQEVLALSSLPQRLDYAARHDIGYVIDDCAGGGMPALYRAGGLCVFASATGTRGAPAAAAPGPAGG